MSIKNNFMNKYAFILLIILFVSCSKNIQHTQLSALENKNDEIKSILDKIGNMEHQYPIYIKPGLLYEGETLDTLNKK